MKHTSISLEKTAKQLKLQSVYASSLSIPLYHLSPKGYSYFEMYPKIYHDPLRSDYEDISEIKRISLSPSLLGASRAISTVNQLEMARLKKEVLVYYIYKPVLLPTDRIITSHEIKRKGLIYDIDITFEHWLVAPRLVRFECVGKLLIDTALNKRVIVPYKNYGTEDKTSRVYSDAMSVTMYKRPPRFLKPSPHTVSDRNIDKSKRQTKRKDPPYYYIYRIRDAKKYYLWNHSTATLVDYTDPANQGFIENIVSINDMEVHRLLKVALIVDCVRIAYKDFNVGVNVYGFDMESDSRILGSKVLLIDAKPSKRVYDTKTTYIKPTVKDITSYGIS